MSDDAIRGQVLKRREEKDRLFRLAHDSPIPHEKRQSFKGLSYFPYDSSYRVVTRFTKHSSLDSIIVETTKGHGQEYLRYGRFEFDLAGKKLTLQAYKPVHHHGQEMLFVPFRDKTSGRETYGAGRYLDIPETGGSYSIDFNAAYNPFCVYSDEYVCPLPPKENWLDVEIRAGERNYESH